MAEIIDNIKVGLFIKSLLKEQQMTQDQLAEKLFITKAAVSQNLNGKSAFDIQNLVKIAEIFNITLDDLVSGRRKRTSETDDAEYVKLIRRGFEKFKTYKLSEMNLATPDVYGKVFIDYLLEEKLHDWIQYLLDKEVELVKPQSHRYKQLIIQVVLYALKHQCGSPEYLLIQFVETFGEVYFVSPLDQDEFFSLLNQKKHESFARIFLTKKIPIEKKVSFFSMSFKQKHDVPFFSTMDSFVTISRLKLYSLYNLYFETHLFKSSFSKIEYSIFTMAKDGFFQAIKWTMESLPKVEDYQSMLSEKLYEVSSILAKAGEVDLLALGIQKGYFQDLNRLCHEAILNNYVSTYEFLLNQYGTTLKIKRLVISLVEVKKFQFIASFPILFNKDILSYALDGIQLKLVDRSLLKNLIKLGAEFNYRYANQDTAAKMNLLIQERE
jgi:transcriptional regulator with XRE-family HTH domain